MNLWELCHYRNRARRAERELRDLRPAYANAIDALNAEKQRAASQPTLQDALLRLDAANEREADLRRVIADLEHHVECMGADNAELERALEAMTKGLRWFEGSDA